MQRKKEIEFFEYVMVNHSLIFISLHLLFDPSFMWEMISHGWWTCDGHTSKLTAYQSEIGYLPEEQNRQRWNLTDKPSVLVTHINFPSVLVTHLNLLRCNNASYPRAERLYNHLVVCDYRELFREISGQTTPLSSKLRGRRVEVTGISNSFHALFLARAHFFLIHMNHTI